MVVSIVTQQNILFRSSTAGFWRASKLPHFGIRVLFVTMEGKSSSESFYFFNLTGLHKAFFIYLSKCGSYNELHLRLFINL